MANLTITAANVIAATGVAKKEGVAGVTIAAGDALYADATDAGKLKLAIATSAAAAAFVGIAVTGAAANQPVLYVPVGQLAIGATIRIGAVYVVSATAGKICPVADLVAGNFVSVIGIAPSAGNLDVYPRVSGVALAA